jgi:excisionase family DNA binding protein
MQQFLTVRQAAQAFQVSEKTIRAWIRRGSLHAAKPGGFTWRIPESELQRLLQGRTFRGRGESA